MVDAETINGLAALDSATIYEAQGGVGALPIYIRPLFPWMKLCGPAFPVLSCGGDNLMAHAAAAQAGPGDILVIGTGHYLAGGLWGDILTLAAQKRGIAGLLTDGCVRDSNTINEMKFPVFSAGVFMGGTTKKNKGTMNQSIKLGGVMISPGDIIVADSDGAVVVAAEKASDVLKAALAREAEEEEKRRKIESGVSTLDLFNLRPILDA
ncbi:4-carboxy-4-hydroxy-2-oxoadipate aldolase/oxaloacetate decarboxylase [Dethiosulfatarculus sandiegensis]|uniref:Putative 4-hydroxy-4-methyl-2-oxoglutarate aldolase n=1 Tax=Dethiosulfatarculus sandiegensis TaxID=1429043 RepID=A0A0D2HJJ2_9BACT|nr:4-carboxy-4-hydroxy-2-oxoadipate aldolase/oxaloacetate decarboxylase [Dethiosulfatarculus sandiegensis]KIX10828.1 4-hydroxy-4-methyl-2-oxoglutarate aldolase [Dethiosulfatarculus sandiegensis]